MRRLTRTGAGLLLIVLAACSGESTQPPQPHSLTDSAIGHYCGMSLVEHVGPKGQIILAGRSDPIWFSSARDTLSFTMLPEEPKDIRAIYVSDMAKAKSWDEPGADNWTDARKALFVIESRLMGGMGAPETVPFSDRTAAERFVAENGGRIVTFTDIPRDYVLGSDDTRAAGPAESPDQRSTTH